MDPQQQEHQFVKAVYCRNLMPGTGLQALNRNHILTHIAATDKNQHHT